MRCFFLGLVGAALLCVGAPACGGSDDSSTHATGGGGSGGSGGLGASGGSAGDAACVPNVGAAQKAVNDYIDSQKSCSQDAECGLVTNFQIPSCTGWCTLALRVDAVSGLNQLAAQTECRTCDPDPYKYYPACLDAGAPSAACSAGHCVVVYPTAENDAGDASMDAPTSDASGD